MMFFFLFYYIELEYLYKLKTLILDNNSLDGPLLPQIGKLSSLKQLTLTKNKLTAITPFIGKLQNLEVLQVNDNNLTYPKTVSSCDALRSIRWGYGLCGDVSQNFAERSDPDLRPKYEM